ncbi:hypothetical protein WJX72_001674 [[Myrmecia] bisecta]|uniref:Uncharacterized protein n=1 Tax=[Myrmecia] bisecta TaxID=41462 RepID=A0AAW1PD25_9CHLO
MPTGSGVEAVRERLRSAVEREAQLRMEAEMKALEVEVLVEQKAALESQLQQERDLRTSMEQELQHVKAALEAELAHPARQQSRELQWELRGAHSAIRALERQVAAAQVDAKAESERRMRLEKQAESERRLWRQPMAPLALGPPPSSPPDHVNAARGQLEQLEPGLGSALKLLQQLSAQAANKQAQQATPLQPQPAAVASPYQPSPHGTPTPAHCPEPPHLIRQAGANEQRIPAGPHAMRRDPLSNTYMHNRGSQEWAGGHRPFPISPNKMTEEVLRRARIEYFEEKNRVRAKRLQELEQLQAAAPQQSA